MRRFRGRRQGRRQSKSRKTRWLGNIWQGSNVVLAAGSPVTGTPYTWVSQWAKWPAGSIDPQSDRVEPSDETLVRVVQRWSLAFGSGVGNVFQVTLGTIAFDGGEFPEFYEGGIFTSNSSFVAPPHPIVNADDDWILRSSYFSTTGTGLAFSPTSLEDGTLWCQSRAMRKLPPNTGVLLVLAINNVLDEIAPVQAINWSVDTRLAARSGYTA